MTLCFRDWASTPADMAALARLSSAQYPEAPVTEQDVAGGLAATDPARPMLLRFALRADHEVAFVESYPSGPDGAFLIELVVGSEAAGAGLETALYAHALAWAQGQGAKTLTLTLREDDARRAFFGQRGFHTAEIFETWAQVLPASQPAPATPPGIRLLRLADLPGRAEEARALVNLGRAEIGQPEYDLLSFDHDFLRYGEDRPDLIALAGADERLVGLAGLVAFADPHSAEGSLVVVVPEWRRGGLGTALVRFVTDQAASAGTKLVTASFAAHLPGATPLLRRAGFQRAPGWLRLRAPLVP